MLTRLLLSCALLSVGASAVAAGEVPALFGERTHAEAAAQAEREGKLLLVDFTASWCPPCHKMDAKTWIDPLVEDWVAEHAVAVQVDVDASPKVAARYAVRAMPTVVVVKDGEELDRVSGYRKAAKLIDWLEGVRAGRSELDALRDDAQQTDVKARYALAKELALRGQDDDASGHLLWLWDHALEHSPSFQGVRTSFMASTIVELSQRHPATRAAFVERFAQATLALEGGASDFQSWSDWQALAEITGQQSEAVRWIEEHVDEDGRLPTASDQRLDDLAQLCVAQGREVVAGGLFADLVEATRAEIASSDRRRQLEAEMVASAGRPLPVMPPEIQESMARRQRDKLRRPLVLALACRRLDEAAQIEVLLLDAEDNWHMRAELLELLLERGAVERRHLTLAQEVLAGAEGSEQSRRAEELDERLRSALDEDG